MAWHKDMSCAEYSSYKGLDGEEESFKQFIRGAKYKQCPKCKFWVEKSEGCNHMECRCGMEFCYACGGVYNDCECSKREMRI